MPIALGPPLLAATPVGVWRPRIPPRLAPSTQPLAAGGGPQLVPGSFALEAPLAHTPRTWLPLSAGEAVADAFTWDPANARFSLRDGLAAAALPPLVKLDLARARLARRRRGEPTRFTSLEDELSRSLDVSRFELYNRYEPWQRRETFAVAARSLFPDAQRTPTRGESQGYCSGAAASATVDELPGSAVTVQGVTFTPRDFELLYAIAHRDGELGVDRAGPSRTDADDATVSPADFHRFVVGNLSQHRSVVATLAVPGAAERWNHPLDRFAWRVTGAGPRQIDGRDVEVYEVSATLRHAEYPDGGASTERALAYELHTARDTGELSGGRWTHGAPPVSVWRPTQTVALAALDPVVQAGAAGGGGSDAWLRRSLQKLAEQTNDATLSRLPSRVDERDYVSIKAGLCEAYDRTHRPELMLRAQLLDGILGSRARAAAHRIALGTRELLDAL